MRKLTKALTLLLLVCMFCTLLPTEAFAATKPDAPTVKTAVSGSAILVSRDSVKYAAACLVYRSDSKDGTCTKIGTASDLSFTDTTVSIR